jgi:hypothetical protein
MLLIFNLFFVLQVVFLYVKVNPKLHPVCRYFHFSELVFLRVSLRPALY